MKKREFTAGILTGALLFGSGSALAASLTATPSTQTFIADGQRIELEAYAIAGNNYVKLRDVGRVMDFGVDYNQSTNIVYLRSDKPYTEPSVSTPIQSVSTTKSDVSTPIQSVSTAKTELSTPTPYTISTPDWSREDFSAAANPSIFTSVYDRALYNAIRQTIVDKSKQDGADYRFAYTQVPDGEIPEVTKVLAALAGVNRYGKHIKPGFKNYYEWPETFMVSCEAIENFAAARAFIQPEIDKVGKMSTDREKVTELNDYLCSLMRYDQYATAGIPDIFAHHDDEIPGKCANYLRAFNFLCSAAEIPSFGIQSENHGWNMVYVEGKWWHVDVSANDISRDQHRLLLVESYPNKQDEDPARTAFLKELLVPGSSR